MILVVGSTGLLGLEICRRLTARGLPVRALVRPGSPREPLVRSLGAEIAVGDLRDATSLAAACRRVSAVVTTANSMLSRRRGDSLETVDRDGSIALLRAAEAAGARRFVFTSVSPTLPADNPFVQYKRQVEAAVRSTGMEWTILQPAAFMEIHAGPAAGWDFQRGRARLMGSGRAPVSFISTTDVAAFAAVAVERPAGARRTLHVAGPEPLTGLAAVSIAEQVTGRRFAVQRLPLAALRVLRAAVSPFSPHLSSLFSMGIAMEGGERVAMEPLLREFAIEATTFEQYVRRMVAAGAGSSTV